MWSSHITLLLYYVIIFLVFYEFQIEFSKDHLALLRTIFFQIITEKNECYVMNAKMNNNSRIYTYLYNNILEMKYFRSKKI
ncbi:hypothetical protein WH47_09847 [Habropoda laboriosa]|uniref:Uncharacterized protein n=1 Tax=Habropoda laboriosa TaxID=597456 RepID=A0A0L7R357_9HYME|nr:hypothetical protein WH47_09847 [Habropoda laboriosa]